VLDGMVPVIRFEARDRDLQTQVTSAVFLRIVGTRLTNIVTSADSAEVIAHGAASDTYVSPPQNPTLSGRLPISLLFDKSRSLQCPSGGRCGEHTRCERLQVSFQSQGLGLGRQTTHRSGLENTVLMPSGMVPVRWLLATWRTLSVKQTSAQTSKFTAPAASGSDRPA
jgi:hypothetical protein